MRQPLLYILFSFIAFSISYLIAFLTEISLVKSAVLFAFIIQWVLFVPAFLFKTEKFYDISGSFTYISIISYVYYQSYLLKGFNLGNLILVFFIGFWAVRLGSFLFLRIHKAGEDKRFRLIKRSPTQFFMTWTFQGMWVSLCSACALTAMASDQGLIINNWFYIGSFLFLFGLAIEIIADYQKTIFRKDEKNKDNFIKTGLWALSRHPNYLGEIILWLGISVISFSSLSDWQYITLISPIFTYLLLVHVSGVRILESNGKKKWGHLKNYNEYIDKTPMLLFKW
tara:strand:+ start:3397 stop:4245 length:849 start_codon:yes stop_codon:yes gene_type:complete